MSDARGKVVLQVDGKDYTLHLGLSVLADLQTKHGQDVLEQLEPPAEAGPDWMPDLNIAVDLFDGALQRFHSDVADRWFIDDLLAQNADAMQKLLAGSSPDGEPSKPAGKGKARKRRS